jgi:hypothetical protein
MSEAPIGEPQCEPATQPVWQKETPEALRPSMIAWVDLVAADVVKAD